MPSSPYYLVVAPGVYRAREQRFNRSQARKEYLHALRYCESLRVLKIGKQRWGLSTEDVTEEFTKEVTE